MHSSSTPTPDLSTKILPVTNLRWYICGALFFGTMVNYVDRGTIAILAPHLQLVFHWSEKDYGWIVFAFQSSYTIMMMISGGIIDRLGTRTGYALAMAWWSVAAAGHALARSVSGFCVARFLLGAGEAGNFPASIKGIAEWFPKKERALATGIFNSGTNVGAVVAYPIVGWLLTRWGWQTAFIATGGLGFVSLVLWLAIYRLPQRHAWITKAELRHIEDAGGKKEDQGELRVPWPRLLGYRKTWGFILAKFMTDPIWWFYVFWLPKYLVQVRGFSIAMLEWFGAIPFLTATIGSIAGGWFSGWLIKRGWGVNGARKAAMLVCASCMPAGIVAVLSGSPWAALALISLATSAHQGWSANLFTLASDMFEKKDVGSVVGLGGAAGAFGGMIIAHVAGSVLQLLHTYVPLFIIAGVMHPVAIGVVLFLVPHIRPETARA
jgi:ACS family hexuronate transporter-like MFS transporter